jgi:outer membrane lipoprotein-sorting protein
MRSSALTTLLFLISLPAAPVSPKEALQPILARMDKAASEFKTMTAYVTYVTHTDVLNEDSPETGTIAMQKVGPNEAKSLIEFLTPDKRTVQFEKRLLRIYYPKLKTVQEWDLSKHGEQLDQFFMIGFGTSGTALAKDYVMTVVGTETLKGPQGAHTIRLRLVPKSGEAHEYVKQLELWIPESGDPYPLQEKSSLPSGDYRRITFNDLKINTPLPPGALQLKLPDGVITEHPGK